MKNRIATGVAAIFLAMTSLLASLASANAQAAPYIVVDARTGDIFAQRNAFKRWQPASLNKLMTAYITFQELKRGTIGLKSPVVQSKNSISEPPSKMGYKVGSVLTVDNALKIILVKSANDISVALGEAVSGSESAFIARMNSEALRLGMTDTNFVNPHGLPSSRQYTTARDMALLGMAIHRDFPEHKWRFNVPAIRSGGKVLRSQNVLLGRFNGADGMKTGFVCASGFNLVGSATQRGRRLIAVVLGARSQNERLETSANLLAGAFRKRRGEGNIRNLRPYGENRATVANIRPEICSSAAQRARWEIRDEQGRLKISTPHIKARTGKLPIIDVSLGGATGPKPRGAAIASVAGQTTNILPRQRPGGFGEPPVTTALRGSSTPTGTQQQLSNAAPAVGRPSASTANPLVPAMAPIPRFRPR
ncbi:MAG: D-alanyl-D-alanine carboxypeptidase family protein [Pseudomonadota bacterium]